MVIGEKELCRVLAGDYKDREDLYSLIRAVQQHPIPSAYLLAHMSESTANQLSTCLLDKLAKTATDKAFQKENRLRAVHIILFKAPPYVLQRISPDIIGEVLCSIEFDTSIAVETLVSLPQYVLGTIPDTAINFIANIGVRSCLDVERIAYAPEYLFRRLNEKNLRMLADKLGHFEDKASRFLCTAPEYAIRRLTDYHFDLLTEELVRYPELADQVVREMPQYTREKMPWGLIEKLRAAAQKKEAKS